MVGSSLGQDWLNQFTRNIGQTEIPALMAEGKSFVIDPH
jgi:hypothetical protein